MRSKQSPMYTIGFAAAVCLVCAVLVSGLSVALKPAQDKNKALDRQRNVLIAAGLTTAQADLSDSEIAALFKRRIEEATTTEGKPLFKVMNNGRLEKIVLPVEGKGLWSTLYGYLAMEADGETISGLAFYQHGETPGLGAEIENPKWQALWKGRKAFDSSGKPVIKVIKGKAGSPKSDPYHVDGLSGATMTSNGVTNLVQKGLSDSEYGRYLKEVGKGGGD